MRFQSVDGLKGLLITLIVYGHFTHVGLLAPFQKHVVDWVYTLHVPLFFVLSGYFFAKSRNAGFDRIVRGLALPYVLIIVMYLASLFVASKLGFSTSNKPIVGILPFLVTVVYKPIGSFWFLHSLVVLQFLWLLVKSPRLSRYGLWYFCIGGALAVVLGVIETRAFVYFGIGAIAAYLGSELPKSYFLGAVALVIAFAPIGDGAMIFGAQQVAWNISLLSFGLACFDGLSKLKLGGLIEWVGRNTMFVLIFHAFFLLILKPFASTCTGFESTGISYSLFGTAFAVLGSVVLGKLLEALRVNIFLFGRETYSPMEVR